MTVDASKFLASINRMTTALHEDRRNILLDEGRLLAKELIRLTPPRGSSPIAESFNAQRKAGMVAVERDIKRVVVPVDELSIVRHPRNPALKSAILSAAGLQASIGKNRKRRDFAALVAILRRVGIKGPIINRVPAGGELLAAHRAARGSRGRVGRRPAQVIVAQPNSVARYVRSIQKHVGRAKKGWMAAAAALGTTGIPNWVSGNPRSSPGKFIDQSRDHGQQFITLINSVAYAGDFRSLGITQFALNNRAKTMRKKLERIMRAAALKKW